MSCSRFEIQTDMKEDILEQIVDDYLRLHGYFTINNVKFRPSSDHPDFILNQDSNHSDIDVVGFHPMKQGPDRIFAVSCKSWQAGFNADRKVSEVTEEKRVAGRSALKRFREPSRKKKTGNLMAAVRTGKGRVGEECKIPWVPASLKKKNSRHNHFSMNKGSRR